MSIKYGSTSITSIICNGTNIYRINYDGKDYCVSCSYSSSSCGSPCTGSSSSTSCNAKCTTFSGSSCSCGGAVGGMGACVIGGAPGTLSLTIPVVNEPGSIVSILSAKKVAEEEILLDTYVLPKNIIEYITFMNEEVTCWEGTYLTYKDNENVPEESQRELKRIYEEIKNYFNEELDVLKADLNRLYPGMTKFEISITEGVAYVYGN